MKRSCEKEFREEGQRSAWQKVPLTPIYRSAAVVSGDKGNNCTRQMLLVGKGLSAFKLGSAFSPYLLQCDSVSQQLFQVVPKLIRCPCPQVETSPSFAPALTHTEIQRTGSSDVCQANKANEIINRRSIEIIVLDIFILIRVLALLRIFKN